MDNTGKLNEQSIAWDGDSANVHALPHVGLARLRDIFGGTVAYFLHGKMMSLNDKRIVQYLHEKESAQTNRIENIVGSEASHLGEMTRSVA